MWQRAVHHDGSALYVSELTPRLGQSLTVRLRTGINAPIRRVVLRYAPNGEQAFIEMTLAETNPPAQWWQAQLPILEPTTHYRFMIEATDGLWFYNANGMHDYEPLDMFDFRVRADLQLPMWTLESVFYQIFPDNFFNGAPENNPTPETFGTEHHGRTPEIVPWAQPLTRDAHYSLSFYGGDLPGIVQKLDHLKMLGVNAIYLNPIFTAYSVHRYDCVDYYHVDPVVGGDDALIALREALNAYDMRYILDIVPNHCGDLHPWFVAATANKHAPEAAYFLFYSHPDDYAAWMNYKRLVKLNFQSQALRDKMYAAEGSIIRHWLQLPFDADGWRVDVGNMLGRQGAQQMNAEVVQGIRDAVKSTKPDAYLLGENFHDATTQLQGDQWDGAMNYGGFARPLMQWLTFFEVAAIGAEKVGTTAPLSTQALEQQWRSRRAVIPWQNALQQFNLIGGHDTNRLRTLLDENDALQRLAVVLQMTYPGIPCVYYGDEIGLEDVAGRVPMTGASRGCMIWDEDQWNHDMLAFYRAIIALRRESSALQQGGYQVLFVEDHTIAYVRAAIDDLVIVIGHRHREPRPGRAVSVVHAGIPDGTVFIEQFTLQESRVHNGFLNLPVQPQGASVWRRA